MEFSEFLEVYNAYKEFNKKPAEPEPQPEPEPEPAPQPEPEPAPQPEPEPTPQPQPDDKYAEIMAEINIIKKAIAPSMEEIKPVGIDDIISKIIA